MTLKSKTYLGVLNWIIINKPKTMIYFLQSNASLQYNEEMLKIECNNYMYFDNGQSCFKWSRRITISSSSSNVLVTEVSVCTISQNTWWRHQMEAFSASLAICAGNSPVPVEFPHKGQWHRVLMFSLICVWINGWVNNRKAGDLRRYRGHYDVTVMILFHFFLIFWQFTAPFKTNQYSHRWLPSGTLVLH